MDKVKERCRKVGMQEKRDTGKEGCRKRGMQEKRVAGKEGNWKVDMWERRNAGKGAWGKEGYRKGESRTRVFSPQQM